MTPNYKMKAIAEKQEISLKRLYMLLREAGYFVKTVAKAEFIDMGYFINVEESFKRRGEYRIQDYRVISLVTPKGVSLITELVNNFKSKETS